MGTLLFTVTWWVLCSLLLASLAMAQQNDQSATEDQSAAEDQYSDQADEGCANPRSVETFSGTENQRTAPFPITGENFRISFETEPAGQDPFLPTVEVDVLNENGRPIGEGFLAFEGEDGSENILAGPGDFRLEIRADEASYDITVEDCVVTSGGDDNSDANGDDDNGDDNIINIPNEPLPNTGGLSLIGLAVLGVVSAAAGLSVIRGGRR
jgi:hypothetical protein